MLFNFFKRKQYEDLKWKNEQIKLGKLSGVDTSVYNHFDLSPTLMEIARKQLELGSSPSAVSKIVESYLKKEIDENKFEELCELSIYIIDLDYLKNKFMILDTPKEQIKRYDYPASFYGAAFGDIAGSQYEFCLDTNARKNLNYNNCITDKSTYTDDTILSCATAKSLSDKIILDKRDFTFYDFSIENTFPFKKSSFTKNYYDFAKKYPNGGYGSVFYQWVLSNESKPYGSYGNGSAMRVSPIIDYFNNYDDIILYSTASAASTHNHFEGVKGANVTSLAGYMAKQGYSKQQIFDYVLKFYNPELMEQYIKQNKTLKDFTIDELKEKLGPAICQFSVPAAIVCFYYSNSYEEVITNCLSFAGDTDTIAAIAGSIAGAYYGVPKYVINIVNEKIPKDLLNEVLNIFKK